MSVIDPTSLVPPPEKGNTSNQKRKREEDCGEKLPAEKRPKQKGAAFTTKGLYAEFGMEETECWDDVMLDKVSISLAGAMANPERLRAIMDEFGVVVIPSVMSEEVVEQVVDETWKMLGSLADEHPSMPARITKEDKSSHKYWGAKIGGHRGNLVQTGSAGSNPSSWLVRTDDNVCKAFRILCDVGPDEPMFTSQDALCVALPTESSGHNSEKPHGNTWLHSDQRLPPGPSAKHVPSFQGQVPFTDVKEQQATFFCIPGSHKKMTAFAGAFPNMVTKDDWVKYTAEHIKWFHGRGCERPFAVKATAGSLILWDSRTIHSGKASLDATSTRIVIYVCQTPARNVPTAVRKRSKKIFLEKRTGNHNTAKMFGKMPRTYGRTDMLEMRGKYFEDSLRLLSEDAQKLARKMVFVD